MARFDYSALLGLMRQQGYTQESLASAIGKSRLVLFGIVFVGRGVDLEPVVRLSDQVAQLVRQDTDFQAVFAQVGQTVARGEEWLKELAGEDGQTP